MPLLGCMSDQLSAWPKDWRKISTWPDASSMGLHLANGQPDTKADQISSWPEVIPLLATRCLYWGLNLTKGHPNPRPDQMSSWPEVIPLLTTRCLYQGWGVMSNQSSIWSKVRPNIKLTWSNTTLGHQMPLLECVSDQRSNWPKQTKCQVDLM